MDTWVNGAKGSDVKKVIDNNFDVLDKRATKINERMAEINNHMDEIDRHMLNLDPLDRSFTASDWFFDENSKVYIISISSADYNKTNPCVEVYIKNEDSYSLVYGAYKIVQNGVDLHSDIPYEGRVIIR